MREELEKLNRKLKRIKIKKIPTTFLSIVDRSFDEVTISKCLAYLIDPEYTSLKVIEQLLNTTVNTNDDTDFQELLAEDGTIYEGIEVEEAISSRSRLDILVKFSTFWIVIENKINSHENDEQTNKYEQDIRNKTDLPVKFICLKPQYNKCKFTNDKFSIITYNQLIEILKGITKYDLDDSENMLYIDDFIKHAEVFFMNDNEIQLNEDVELYIENKKVIDDILKIYKKQCELVRNKLEQQIVNRFGEDYDVYCSKNGYLQVWKKKWDNENHMGLHYEILCDFNAIINYETEVKFAIHNEMRTKKKYPSIKHGQVFMKKYNLSDSNSIEQSLNKIVDELYQLAEENNAKIDELF